MGSNQETRPYWPINFSGDEEPAGEKELTVDDQSPEVFSATSEPVEAVEVVEPAVPVESAVPVEPQERKPAKAAKRPKTLKVPRWPGVLLALLTILVLTSTMDMGFSRDEGYYFKAGELYSRWYEELVTEPGTALTKRSVDRHWAYNPEHPPLAKTLIGISWRLLGTFPQGEAASDPDTVNLYHSRKVPDNQLALMKESTAMRFPAVLFAALMVYLVYRMGAMAYSVKAGVFGSIAMMAMPRLFFHSHLACFDLPIAAMWFLTVYVFWRASSRSSWWLTIAAGICWGLAIATKHNGYFIPIVLVLWWLPRALADFKLTRRKVGGLGLRLPSIPMPFISMLILGPTVLYLLWPKLWFNPVGHWVWYFKRHFHHEYYWAYYFGDLLANPPFPAEFPWVMTLVTVPVVTILLAVLGMGGRLAAVLKGSRDRDGEGKGTDNSSNSLVPRGGDFVKGTDRLIFLNLIFPIAIFSTTTTPIFGGTKHWMPAMPYLALFAGVGFHMVCKLVNPQIVRLWGLLWGRPVNRQVVGLAGSAGGETDVGTGGCADAGAGVRFNRGAATRSGETSGSRWRSWLGSVLMGALLLAPSVIGVVRVWPEGPCYYNELLGGFRGMGNYRMQREFWGNAAGNVLDWVNENAPLNATVFFHDTNYDSFLMYKRDGALRKDIKYARSMKGSRIALFHHHAEFLDREQSIWEEYGTDTPVHGFYLDGVPILSVYENFHMKAREEKDAANKAAQQAKSAGDDAVQDKKLMRRLAPTDVKQLTRYGLPNKVTRPGKVNQGGGTAGKGAGKAEAQDSTVGGSAEQTSSNSRGGSDEN